MGKQVSAQLRIWLARGVVACLAWCLAFGTFGVAFGSGDCEEDCPCEAAAVDHWANDAETAGDSVRADSSTTELRGAAVGVAEHSGDCPRGCPNCDGVSVAGIVVGREDLAPRLVMYFDVATGQRFDGPAQAVVDGVFRPPRRAS